MQNLILPNSFVTKLYNPARDFIWVENKSTQYQNPFRDDILIVMQRGYLEFLIH